MKKNIAKLLVITLLLTMVIPVGTAFAGTTEEKVFQEVTDSKLWKTFSSLDEKQKLDFASLLLALDEKNIIIDEMMSVIDNPEYSELKTRLLNNGINKTTLEEAAKVLSDFRKAYNFMGSVIPALDNELTLDTVIEKKDGSKTTVEKVLEELRLEMTKVFDDANQKLNEKMINPNQKVTMVLDLVNILMNSDYLCVEEQRTGALVVNVSIEKVTAAIEGWMEKYFDGNIQPLSDNEKKGIEAAYDVLEEKLNDEDLFDQDELKTVIAGLDAFDLYKKYTSSGGGGGGGGGGSSTPTTPNKETKPVSSKGEKVEFLKNHVVVEVPSGAFEDKVDITVEEIAQKTVKLPEQASSTAKMVLASKIFEFKAQGKTFKKPITITIKYDPDKVTDPQKLGIYHYNESKEIWEYVGGFVNTNNKTVSVTLNHFSKYAVMGYEKTFTDIKDHWAREDIELMASRHIAQGMTETTFVPNGDVTRAEFATFLVRALGLTAEKDGDNSSFVDVALESWYAPYIEAAYDAGLVKGMSETTFAPNANITREEMATMIMRAYNSLTGEDYTKMITTKQIRFQDESKISSWAHQAVVVANDLDIIKGMTIHTFEPKSKATRAQSAVMIKRLLQVTKNL